MARDDATRGAVTAAKVIPFDPSRLGDDQPQFDVNPFTPQRTDANDPVPETGIDLSGKPKVVFVAGRGKTGKTTLLRWAAEMALAESRAFLMADIDPTNASFASYFRDVSRPNTDDPAGVTRWLQQFIEYAIQHRTSALIDLGGGDTTLRTIAAEMPGFADQVEAAGVSPVVFYLAGTQPEDLAPIAALAARNFHPAARAIVLNESVAELGLNRQQAFGHVVRNRIFLDQMATGAICLWMPRLHAAAAVEIRRSSFAAARDGRTDPPLGLFDRARVKAWLEGMAHQFQGVRSWMA
jgi:hypothetical protein